MWQLSLGAVSPRSELVARSEAQKPSMRAHCHGPAARAVAARRIRPFAVLPLALLTACLADAVDAPGADRTPVAHLSLNAQVGSLGTSGAAEDRTVEVRAFYRRTSSNGEGTDERTLASSPSSFPVAPGTTTEKEIIVQIAACLADAQRVDVSDGGCRLGIELRLLDATGGTLATETAEPPDPVGPGSKLDLGTVALADVSVVEVAAVPDPRLRVGRTLQLRAGAKNAQGVAVDRTFRWTSSDPSVAQVDQATGLVTGVKAGGPVAITASSGGKRAQVTLTVIPRVATVDVNPTQAAVKVNGAVQLAATPKDAGGTVLTDRPIRWDADNSGVFAVSPNGLLTGVRPGTGELTVTADDSVQRKVPVTVTAGGVTVAPNPASVAVNGTAQLTATVTDANGAPITNQTIAITWSSGSTGIATVDANGVVTGRAVGQAAITAAGGGASGQVTVNVVSQVLNLLPSNPTIQAARTVQLTAENVLGVVTWGSSDNNIAAVSAGGLVTGQRPGTATITATSGVQSGRTSVTVTAGRVDVTPNPASVPKGETLQLTAVVRNADGAPIPNVPISWDSNNLGAATVNSSTGAITAVAEGQATITASGGGARGTGLVTVTPALVGSIELSPLPQGAIYPGTAFQLTATVKDARGNPLANRVVSFQSSNAAVVTVTPTATTGTTGLAAATVTIVAPGTATLSATVEDKPTSVDVTVTPLPPSRIEKTSADNVECPVGSVACQFAVKVTNALGQPVGGAQVKWTSTGGCTETVTLSTDATGISRTGNVCAIATAGSYAQTAELAANGDKVSFPFKVTALPTLSVTAGSASTGTGTVTSQAGLTPAINCTMNKTAQSGDCSRSYQPNTQITLTAAVTNNSTFAGWGGACSGTSPTCTIALTAAQSVTASFTAPQQPLTVALSGTGTGSVTSSVGGIDCRLADGKTTGTCASQLPFGTTVTLQVLASNYGIQVTANGGCTVAGPVSGPQVTCVMDQPRNVAVVITAPPKALDISAGSSSTGTGQVTSQTGLAPAINCLITATARSSDCRQEYPVNTQVTLTATPTQGARFTGWGGDCSARGTQSTCTFDMSAARSVNASFAPTLKATFKSSTQNPDIVTSTVLIDVTSDGGTASDLNATVTYAQGQRSGYVQVVGFDRTVTPAVLTLTVDRSALPTGTYNWTVTVTSTTSGVAPATQNIVTTVTPGLYYRFKDQTPRAPTGTLRFDIGSFGGTASGLRDSVAYDAGQPSGYWTAVTLDRTATPAVLSLQWSTSGIPLGTYNSTITVSSTTAGYDPLPVRITFIVTAAASQIVVAQVHTAGGAATPSAVSSTRAMRGAVSRPAPNPR